MDWATKGSVVVLGLFLSGVIWWIASGATRERRRTTAEAKVRAQISMRSVGIEDTMGKHHLPEVVATAVPPPRTGKHDGAEAGAVSVTDLLERAMQAGDPLRLNWPEDDADDEPVGVRSTVQEEFPTGVLPRISDWQGRCW